MSSNDSMQDRSAAQCDDGRMMREKDEEDCGGARVVPLAVRNFGDQLKKIYLKGTILVGYGLCEEGGGKPVDDVFVSNTLVLSENLEHLFSEAPAGAKGTIPASRPSHALHCAGITRPDSIELSDLFVTRPGESTRTTDPGIHGIMAIGSGGIGKSAVLANPRCSLSSCLMNGLRDAA